VGHEAFGLDQIGRRQTVNLQAVSHCPRQCLEWGEWPDMQSKSVGRLSNLVVFDNLLTYHAKNKPINLRSTEDQVPVVPVDQRRQYPSNPIEWLWFGRQRLGSAEGFHVCLSVLSPHDDFHSDVIGSLLVERNGFRITAHDLPHVVIPQRTKSRYCHVQRTRASSGQFAQHIRSAATLFQRCGPSVVFVTSSHSVMDE